MCCVQLICALNYNKYWVDGWRYSLILRRGISHLGQKEGKNAKEIQACDGRIPSVSQTADSAGELC